MPLQCGHTYYYWVTAFKAAIESAAVSGSVTTAACSNSLVSGLSVASGKPYDLSTLTPDTLMYLDRNFTYTTIPDPLAGKPVLRTDNDDKFSDAADLDFIKFTVNQDARVYVLYTTVNTTLTSIWLNGANGWADESMTVTTTLSPGEANRLVRSKFYRAGNMVQLGGNGSTSGTSSMYTVVVVPAVQ
jgi:hypothetical protein